MAVGLVGLLRRAAALIEVAGEPPADHLAHRGRVVDAVNAAHREAAVLRLASQPVLEHDHARDDVGALHVGDVEALDPQWGLVEVEGLLDLRHRLAAGGEVTGPPGLVQRKRLLGVLLDGLQQRLLVAALRHAQRDVRAAQAAEPLGERVRLGWHRGDQYLSRHVVGVPHRHARAGDRPAVHGDLVAVGVVLAVRLEQELADQLTRGEVLHLVDDEAALAANPAAADVEDLDGRLELVLGDADHVGVGGIGQHDGLLLHRPGERADVVAQPGCPLVLLAAGGLGHVTFHPAHEPGGLSGHEVAEVADDLAVPLRGDAADARRRALVDVAEQAGPADLSSADEDALAAGAGREDSQQQI
jgi:hypothetical protein